MNDIINDRIDVVTKGFLGLTVACARCHDHMFDPIPTKDYYALHGVFASIDRAGGKAAHRKRRRRRRSADFQKKLAALEQENRDDLLRARRATFRRTVPQQGRRRTCWPRRSGGARQTRRAAQERDRDHARAQARRDVHAIFGRAHRSRTIRSSVRWRRSSTRARRVRELARGSGAEDARATSARSAAGKCNPIVAAAFERQAPPQVRSRKSPTIYSQASSPSARTAGARRSSKPSQGRDRAKPSPASTPPTSQICRHAVRRCVAALEARPPIAIRGRLDASCAAEPADARRAGFEFAKINELELTHPGAPARAMVVADKPSSRRIRRSSSAARQRSPRRHRAARASSKSSRRTASPSRSQQGSGRLELAQCIASKDNPLTARVIVNRVWMHHFGEGFVRTPDDLGTQSETPTHPELLDYLAS